MSETREFTLTVADVLTGLRTLGDAYVEMNVSRKPFKCDSAQAAVVLRAAEKLIAQVPCWISVDERLPEIGVSVLCCSEEPPGEGLVWIGQREQYEWYFPGANEMGTPSHWMPLPEPST